MPVDNTDQQSLKQKVLEERGYWHPFHEVLLKHAPEYLRSYLSFVGASEKTDTLTRKERELIYIAVNASVAHMYGQGLRRHIELALKHGATLSEVIEAVQIATSLAGQTFALGFEVFCETFSSGAQALPQETRNDVPGYSEALASLDPEFAKSYLEFIGAAWQSGTLSHKTKELLALAVNAAPTTLNKDGIRHHMKRAVAAGATRREVLAVLQLSSAIAVHTCTLAFPALGEVIAGDSSALPT